MCDISLESFDFHSERHRVARKRHRCSSCTAVIEPGETYAAVFFILEGDASNERMCWPCRTAMKKFGDAPGHMECNPSYFPDMLESCVVEGDFDDDEESDAPSTNKWAPMLRALKERRAQATALKAGGAR